MVWAGTYTRRSSADKEVEKLKKMGFMNARVGFTNRGKYAVVVVDSYDNMADAERLKKELGTKGVRSLIKMRER
jgi:cell division protein FtsN